LGPLGIAFIGPLAALLAVAAHRATRTPRVFWSMAALQDSGGDDAAQSADTISDEEMKALIQEAMGESIGSLGGASGVASEVVMDRLMAPEVQQMLQDYAARITALREQADVLPESVTELLTAEGADLEATQTELLDQFQEVQRLELEARKAAARQSELRMELESLERMQEAAGFLGDTPAAQATRRTALIAVGGILGLQALRVAIERSQISPPPN